MNTIYISDLLPEEDLAALLSMPGTGLESIQFSIGDNLDHLQETLKKEKQRLSALGHPPLTLHGPFLDLNPMSYDSRIQRATGLRFAQAWEAARELGATKIIYHSGMIPSIYYLEGWAQRMADFWNQFLEDRSGVAVCMENVLDQYPRPLAEVCSQVHCPDFGVCLDIGHAFCYGKDPLQTWAETLKGCIRHIHVHDNNGSRDQHLALGAGKIPYRETLSRLLDSNDCTVECSTREDVLTSLQKLRELMHS